MAYSAFIDGPGVDATNDQAIWSGLPGALNVRVRKGDPAVEAGPGVRFNGFFFHIRIDGDGDP